MDIPRTSNLLDNPRGDSSPSPSPQFLHAAQQLAHGFGLDIDRVVDGCPMQYGTVKFWLQHYGPLDAEGMVLMIETGSLAAESAEQSCRKLLEYNYLLPAGLCGYNAVL